MAKNPLNGEYIPNPDTVFDDVFSGPFSSRPYHPMFPMGAAHVCRDCSRKPDHHDSSLGWLCWLHYWRRQVARFAK